MLLFPPLHRDASLFQPAQIITFGKILPVHGQVGVVVGVVQDVRLAVHLVQALPLGGKAPCLYREDFSESDDLRGLKEGRITVQWRE